MSKPVCDYLWTTSMNISVVSMTDCTKVRLSRSGRLFGPFSLVEYVISIQVMKLNEMQT